MVSQLDPPVFLDTDINKIVSESIAFFETATGKTLQPAQVERIMIDVIAYREGLVRNSINEAAKLNLVAFSKGVILDYLGQLVGVSRLPEQPATVDIVFTMPSVHAALVIPLGMRVASNDGKAQYFVPANTSVAANVTTVTITCICATAGIIGNGYVSANITQILDPMAGVTSASNSTTSANGVDAETDEQLQARIILAPEAFSVAGPVGAYKFFTFSADQLIIDVEVISPVPGTVNVYPLVAAAGGTPGPILAKVVAILSDEKVRPLTDTVNVLSPSASNYSITVNVTLYDDADVVAATASINSALSLFAAARRAKLGRDIIVAQIAALATIKDVTYNTAVAQPVADIVIGKDYYSNCTGITVNIIGTNVG